MSDSEFRPGMFEINLLWQEPIVKIEVFYRSSVFYESYRQIKYEDGNTALFVLVERSHFNSVRAYSSYPNPAVAMQER